MCKLSGKCDFDIIDFIEKGKYIISIGISVFFSFCYVNFKFINSIRIGVSDIISISSILLAVLGVFIGLLISLRDSDFMKKIDIYMKEGETAFNYLLTYIKKQFIINLIFVFITAMIDFIPAVTNALLKGTLIAIWFGLLCLTLWGTFYIVNIIVKLELNDYKSSKKDDNSTK